MLSSVIRRIVPTGIASIKPCVQLATMSASNGKLQGKVAVVTASTEGIGLAIARRLAQDGASVVVSSRKEKNVSAAVQELQNEGLKVTGIVCHVAKQSDREKLLKEAVDKFGGVDILVSNAAANPVMGPVLECPEDAWDKIFEVNVKAAFLLSKDVVPLMEKRGGGSIIYVSSIAGLQPQNGLGAYSVSKTALLGLTKAAAQQLALDKIRVNCIAPGFVKTRFSSAIADDPTLREAVLSTVPMRRFGQPHEIASVASFLSSEDASYITGEVFVAAGGLASRL